MERQPDARREQMDYQDELRPPPRFLLWVLIGLVVLAILGGVTGIILFRSVLRPGQQERVIEALPFMEAFLNRPPADATIPTVAPPANGGLSPEDLLNSPLLLGTEETTPEAEATGLAAGFEPSATPAPTATPTSVPTTPTPTEQPAAESASLSLPDLGGVSVALADDGEEAVVQQDGAVQTSAASLDIPRTARLYGFRHVQQTWNNCGPANITMALSYYGWQDDQTVAAGWLKPDREDKNVSPHEMTAFVNENSGVRAAWRLGGDMELLKAFLAHNFPVIIETAYAPEGYDWIGHYQTVVGYDDNQQIFYLYDSYLGSGENGEGMAEPYTEFDANWQAFNRVFIVIYDQQRESLVQDILGERADVARSAELALETAQREARANPQNRFAWFNMGTSLAKLERYDEAAVAFDRALQLELPFRMLWYQFGPFEAYFNTGRYDDVVALANNNLTNGGEYVEETYYWKGRALAALGQTQEAAAAFNLALNHNPRYEAARLALNQLG